MNTRQKAHIACCRLEELATKHGFIVSTPSIEARYDKIIDTGFKLYRTQVKYCDRSSSSCKGAVGVDLSTKYNKVLYTKGYDQSEVDCLVVYVARVEKLCVFLPVIFENKSSLQLRFAGPLNNQKNIRRIDDYLFDTWAISLKERHFSDAEES